jgi:myo-inositol-1(or 4)-monophosphatase
LTLDLTLSAEHDISADLDLMLDAAQAAGELALQYWKRPLKWERKADGSVVTEADLAVNALLEERLRKPRPHYGWLSEESADTTARLARQRVWLLDPIDGTHAFFKGGDEWTIALSLIENARPVVAVVYNAVHGEVFSAMRGHGAWLNGKRIRTTSAASIEGARLMAADGVLRKPIWRESWPQVEIVRVASLAYRLAFVACGRADAAFALTPRSEWDVAAGALLVEEAGGVATTHLGEALTFNQPVSIVPSFLAAGKNLHKILADRIRLGLKEMPQRDL